MSKGALDSMGIGEEAALKGVGDEISGRGADDMGGAAVFENKF